MQYITIEEILSQPNTWKSVVREENTPDSQIVDIFKSAGAREVVFIGCGTSFYLAQAAATMYSMVTGNRAKASTASDISFYPDAILPGSTTNYLPILISRSGSTTEVIRVAQQLSNMSFEKIIGVSCRPESDLPKVTDHAILVPAADEKSVVMTRSFSSMLLALIYHVANAVEDRDLLAGLTQLPRLGQILIDKSTVIIEDIISTNNFSKFVYLGQGPFYGLASEAMLKIKEMSLASSEAYHSFEYRHGPMSIADEDMLITFLISDNAVEEELKLMAEMRELGAKTLVICDRLTGDLASQSDYTITLDSDLPDCARLVLYMPLLQLIGYYNALAKGLNPDKPKNLSQVVALDS